VAGHDDGIQRSSATAQVMTHARMHAQYMAAMSWMPRWWHRHLLEASQTGRL